MHAQLGRAQLSDLDATKDARTNGSGAWQTSPLLRLVVVVRSMLGLRVELGTWVEALLRNSTASPQQSPSPPQVNTRRRTSARDTSLGARSRSPHSPAACSTLGADLHLR